MNTVTLVDPQSGHRVYVRMAELPQKCAICSAQLQGGFIATVEGYPLGWVCLPHLERLLMSVPPSEIFKARAKVKEQLIHKNPGDVTTVTRSLLVALEAW